jgi:hypothetical protein
MSGCLTHDAETAHLEEFLDWVTPTVHNAPVDLAMAYVRRAAVEFCERMPVVKDVLVLVVQANVADYLIEWGNPELIPRAVTQVWAGTIGLSPLQRRPVVYSSSNLGFWFEAPAELLISPAPRQDLEGWLTLEVIAKPTPQAEHLPRILHDQYAEAIGDGALSRMLLMKTADWYDPQAAGIHLKRFQAAMGRGRQHLTRGATTGPLMARGPRWI